MPVGNNCTCSHDSIYRCQTISIHFSYPLKKELQVEFHIILSSYRAVNTFHLGYKNQLMLKRK